MLLVHAALALGWMLLTGDFSLAGLLFGAALGYFLIWVAWPEARRTGYVVKVPRAIGFLAFFLRELLVANVRVFLAVIGPLHRLRPAIVAVPLDLDTDATITLLANVITLTPGTLSVYLSPDHRTLYVHVMQLDDPEAFRRSVKDGFERRIRELAQ